MITMHYGHRVDQCDSANFVHGTPPDCCTGCTGNCPCWGWPWGATITEIQNNWTHWNFDYTYKASSLSWEDFKATVSTTSGCGKSPVQVVWWWTPVPYGGGHVVNAYGYAEIGNDRYVSYINPLPVDCAKKGNTCSPVGGGGEDAVTTYDAFVSSAAHTWGNSFYGFKYTGP